MDKYCGNQWLGSKPDIHTYAWTCTLDVNHKGDHEAHGYGFGYDDRLLAEWNDDLSFTWEAVYDLW